MLSFIFLKVMKTGQKLQKYRMLNLEMLIKSKERFLKVKFIILVERAFYAKITDGTGFIQIRLFFFSNPQANAFIKGLKIRIYGVVRNTGNKLEVFIQAIKYLLQIQRPPLDNTLTPIYSVGSSKISQFRLRNIIKNCINKIPNEDSSEKKIDDVFYTNNISELSIKESLQIIHSPSVKDEILKIKNFSSCSKKINC